MRDYITKVIDTPLFRDALRAEVAAGSPYCYIDDADEVKLTFAMTPLKATGVKSTTVCRLSDAERNWFAALPQAAIIGNAKAELVDIEGEMVDVSDGLIRSFEDIEWVIDGEARYYAAYNRTPVTYTDDEGNEVTITPPLIQGVLACKRRPSPIPPPVPDDEGPV